jgi:hypothetical protein
MVIVMVVVVVVKRICTFTIYGDTCEAAALIIVVDSA